MSINNTVHLFDRETGILTYDNGDFCFVPTGAIENEFSFDIIKKHLVKYCNISATDDVLMFS